MKYTKIVLIAFVLSFASIGQASELSDAFADLRKTVSPCEVKTEGAKYAMVARQTNYTVQEAMKYVYAKVNADPEDWDVYNKIIRTAFKEPVQDLDELKILVVEMFMERYYKECMSNRSMSLLEGILGGLGK